MAAIPKPPAASPGADLRRGLHEAGFSTRGLRDLLGATENLPSSQPDLDIYRRRLAREGDPRSDLIRLFVLMDPIAAAAAPRAMGGAAYAAAVDSGLVEEAGGQVRAAVRLMPHGDLLIASDGPGHVGGDVVTGINSPASMLAGLTIRRPARRCLDLGAGNGIQSLLASRHSERVVATDVNPRALAFTELNAAINGAANIETRLGSWLEPVAGEAFDLIVSNPPYVVSPDSELTYRDSGLPLDEVSRMLVRALPDHLAEGGFAQLLISWAVPDGSEWDATIRPWFEGLPADALLMYFRTHDPVTHATLWNQMLRPDPAAHAAAIDRWIGFLSASGVGGIAYGAVALRRRSGNPWTRFETLREGSGSSGPHLERIFANLDLLAAADAGGGIGSLAVAVADGATLEQRLRWEGGELRTVATELGMGEGISYRGQVDPGIVHLLQALDGRRTVDEATEHARAEGAAEGSGQEDFKRLALAAVRRLLELGLLRG